MNLVSQLRQNPWFGSLPINLSQEIVSNCSIRKVKDGEFIYNRDDCPDGIFCLLKGVVVLVRADGSLDNDPIEILPFDWFGEVAAIDGKPYGHDAKAAGDVQALQLTKATLIEIGSRHAEFGMRLAELLALHSRDQFDRLKAQSHLTARDRLLRFLMRESSNRMELSEPAAVAGSQHSLALRIGVSRQTINLLLKDLVREGSISTRYRHIVILNESKLKSEMTV